MVSAEGFWVHNLAHILGDFLGGFGDGGSGMGIRSFREGREAGSCTTVGDV